MFSALSILMLLLSLKKGKLWWALWILTTLGAIYADYFAFLVWFFEIIIVIFFFKKASWRFLLYNVLIVGLFLPWLPTFLAQIKNGAQATKLLPSWGLLTNLSLERIIPVTFAKFSLGRISFDNKIFYFGAVLSLFVGYAALLINTFGRERKTSVFLLTWMLIPILLATIISISVPSYQPFRLLLVFPAFILLLAVGIYSLKNKRLRITAMFIICLISIFSLGMYYFDSRFQRENWREAVTYLENHSTQDTLVIFSSSTSNWPYLFYQKKQLTTFGATDNLIIDSNNLSKSMTEKTSEKKDIWLMRYLQPLFDPRDLTKSWLENSGYVKIEEKNFNGVEIWHYENRN